MQKKMNNIFSDTEISKIIINKNVYILHNYVLRKMDLFNVLSDINSREKILELEWPISIENINKIFLCMYRDNFSSFTKEKSLSCCIEIISFMKYVGINEKHILNVCNFMTPVTLEEFIIECNKIEYNSEIKYIYETTYVTLGWTSLIAILSISRYLISNNFPIDLKKEIISVAIKSLPEVINNFNIVFGITYLINNMYHWKRNDIHKETVNLEYIKTFYENLGFTIDSYLITHSGLKITQIKINDKKIEIDNLINECPMEGTIGVNIFEAILEHVIRLLLKIDSLYLYNESIVFQKKLSY
jgi:hypothetical protein